MKKPISKIFEDDGAEGFREAETSVLNEACSSPIPQSPPRPRRASLLQPPATHRLRPMTIQVASYARFVVSTGGGIVTSKENWGHLHNGIVVYLDTPVECGPPPRTTLPARD